jgi:hypothetical protein
MSRQPVLQLDPPVLPLLALLGLWACSSGSDAERAERGLELSPVQLNLEGKDRSQVGLGSYIVNAQAACNDCHTAPPYEPGGNPYQGQPERINAARFLGGAQVPGPGGVLVTAPNLTPDANGRPGGLTEDAFVELIRTGKENGDILQVMPWPVYGKMSDQELRAIYAYLTAIPRVQ